MKNVTTSSCFKACSLFGFCKSFISQRNRTLFVIVLFVSCVTSSGFQYENLSPKISRKNALGSYGRPYSRRCISKDLKDVSCNLEERKQQSNWQKFQKYFSWDEIADIFLLKIPMNPSSSCSITSEDFNRLSNQFETIGFDLMHHKVSINQFGKNTLTLTLKIKDLKLVMENLKVNEDTTIEDLKKYDGYFNNEFLYGNLASVAGWASPEKRNYHRKYFAFHSVINIEYYFGWQFVFWIITRFTLLITYNTHAIPTNNFYYPFLVYSYMILILTFVQFGFTHVIYVELMNLVLGSVLGWFINNIVRLIFDAKDTKLFTKLISKAASFIQTFLESFIPYWTQPGGNNDPILKSCWNFMDWIFVLMLAVFSHEYMVHGENVESEMMSKMMSSFIYRIAVTIAYHLGFINDIQTIKNYTN